MEIKRFKVGDVVELNSGGPKMTVINDDVPGLAKCEWFVPNLFGYRIEVFPMDALQKVKQP